jgi:hypothetical protein
MRIARTLSCSDGVFSAVFLLALACLTPSGTAHAAEFVRVGDLIQGRDMGMAAPLPDGRVLVTGGVGLDAQGNGVYLASAELFDPATGTFSSTGAMRHGRDGNATITPLADGRVLIAGGISQNASGQTIALASAEVYDPKTGRFKRTANNMSSVRYFHAAARLPDGRVLVAGGWGQDGRLASADVYDPATNRFTRVGDMSIERNSHTATTLPNGRVLIAGGLTTDAEMVSSAEVFDPATGRFKPTGSLAGPRMMATSSPLKTGKPLIVGGMENGEWRPAGEIYDPSTRRFSSTGALQWPRADHAQTTLPDGRVLISAGGLDESGWRAERYDPTKRRFEQVANMSLGRGRAATALLPDGRVLVAGGVRPWEPPLAYAEVYVPTAVPGPYPDLSLSLWSSGTEIKAGRPFRYVLTLRNEGAAAAEKPTLEAELPPGIAIARTQVIDSPNSGPWNCDLSGTTLRCASEDAVPMPPRSGPGQPAPAVSVIVDAIAPDAPDTILFALALASTSSVEDITGNNEAIASAYVYASAATARAGATGTASRPKAAASAALRPGRADPIHGLQQR